MSNPGGQFWGTSFFNGGKCLIGLSYNEREGEGEGERDLFVLRLNIPVNNFSFMPRWSQHFLRLTSTLGGL